MRFTQVFSEPLMLYYIHPKYLGLGMYGLLYTLKLLGVVSAELK
jgi:hypothetical protein